MLYSTYITENYNTKSGANKAQPAAVKSNRQKNEHSAFVCVIGNGSGEIEWVGRVWERGGGGAGVAVHSIARR